MRPTLVTVSVLVVLALPAPALAKEISAMKVCGPDACTTLKDRSLLSPLMENAGAQVATPEPAPFYRVTLQVSEPRRGVVGGWDTWYVPSAALFQERDESNSPMWHAPPAKSLGYLRARLASLKPFPAPRFTRVELGMTAVREPSSYSALFDPTLARATDYADDWKPVTITASRPNPWTADVLLSYSPSKNIFWHGSERVRLPDRLAANLEGGRSALASVPDSGSRWGWIGGTAAAIVLGGGAFGILRARR